MRKFLIFLICIILPFMCLVPYSSSAFDVQGTEYDDPGLLPPDIDFTAYDYYFLTFSGTADSPIYKLYLVKDNGNTGRLYFSVAKFASDTRYYSGDYTAYDITTNYYVDVTEYNNSTGLWGAPYKASSVSNSSKFVFDNYSVFESTCKYIIGANCNIYSYFGTLVRSGDYDVLNLFFLGGLKGSTDKTEQPAETTTTTTTNNSGGSSIDLSGITDIIKGLADSLTTIIDALNGLKNGTASSDLTDRLDSIHDLIVDIKSLITDIKGSIFSLSDLTSYLDDKFSDISLNIAKIASDTENLRNNFWEFASLGGHIQKLAELIAHVDTAIQQLDSSFSDKFDSVVSKLDSVISAINNNKVFSDFEDVIRLIQSDTHSSRLYLDSINTKIPEDFADIINSIRSDIHDIKSHVENIKSRIPLNFVDINGSINADIHDIKLKLGDIDADFKATIDGLSDIASKLSDIFSSVESIAYYSKWINSNLTDFSKNFLDFCDALFDHLRAIEGYIIDVYNSIGSLPDNFETLLKKLFVPTTTKPEELTKIISEHFEFVHQIADMADVIFDSNNFDTTAPEYNVEFDSDLYGHFKSKIIDFDVVPYDYIVWFKALVSGITCYFFIRKVRKRLPNIINGESAP